MKKLIFLIGICLSGGVSNSFAQSGSNNTSLTHLLNNYYEIKSALVNSDAAKAASAATSFVNAAKSVDMKALSENDRKALIAVQEKLKADAQSIASSGKIEGQRTAFASLSGNIYALAKSLKLSEDKIYQQYCPMKKMYWLSNEAAIKNPYYGNSMLTCGKLTDTLK
jgi:hypothetical protein